MTQTTHGHHIDQSGIYDDKRGLAFIHCGARRGCKLCTAEMAKWDLFSANCEFCNTPRKFLIASVCPNCHREWADRF